MALARNHRANNAHQRPDKSLFLAMGSSLIVYDYVKTAGKKTPGLKTLAE